MHLHDPSLLVCVWFRDALCIGASAHNRMRDLHVHLALVLFCVLRRKSLLYLSAKPF